MWSKESMKSDFNASIVVFLVALPLAMGISIASGYPPAAGLITGVVGGIIVGFLSGSPLQVSGAAAGLAVIVFDGVQRFGLQTMGVVVLLAGLMQVLAAGLRLGRWFQAVSPTVLYGMLAGIGILIVGSQVHVMIDAVPIGGGLENLFGIPSAIWRTLQSDAGGSIYALGLGLLTIGAMILWPRLKNTRLGKVPAPLAAVLLASVVASVSGLSVNFVTIPDDLMSSWRPTLPTFADLLQNPAIIGAAIQLALIASAESLLCAGAVDQMHDGERTRYNQELAAQGLGNAICGVLGALPMTGVIVRSSANVQSGAKTRLSTILHGCWILLFVALLPGLLKFVPVASLAGLLVFTGVKLVNVKAIREIRSVGKVELGIYAITVGTIVAVDLLTGVLAGLALSGIRLLQSLSRLSIDTDHRSDEEVVVKLQGAATFLRLPTLSSTLESLPPKSRVVLQSKELHLMDHACVQHLETWRRRHIGTGGQVLVESGESYSFETQSTMAAPPSDKRRRSGQRAP